MAIENYPSGVSARLHPNGNDVASGRSARAPGTGIAPIDDALSFGNEVLIGGIEGLYGAAAALTDPVVEYAYRKRYGDAAVDQLMDHVRSQRHHASDAAARTFVSQPNPIARKAGRLGGALTLPVPRIRTPFINWLAAQGKELGDLLNGRGAPSQEQLP